MMLLCDSEFHLVGGNCYRRFMDFLRIEEGERQRLQSCKENSM